jgi:FAD/FMN-containing dehydrogenase
MEVHMARALASIEGFKGSVLRPGDPGFEETKKGFNAMYYDRDPAVIASCTDTDDVIAALRVGRENGLAIAVRGGGHAVAGYGMSDGGLLIDLRPMKDIQINGEAKTARAQAGLTWGEFDAKTQEVGLATTGGRVTTTGISGLTLGSGSGWLERKHGFVLDNLLSVDVVTADGEVVTASADQNEDLFFGLRGGGGNFGIATSFEYKLHDLGPMVMGGMLVHTRDAAPQVIRGWRDVMDEAPDELGGAVALLTAPPEPFVPEELQMKPVLGIIVLYAGSVDDAENVVRPLRELGSPLDIVAPMPYAMVQTLLDGGNPPGRHQYWKSENVSEFTDDAIDTFIDHSNRATSPFTVSVIEPKRGAITRAATDEDMALGGRDAACTYYGFAAWEDPAEADEHIGWARDLAGAMKPFTTAGVSLNFLSETGQDRVRSTFGDAKYEKLVALKRKYDPENVFRLNANIKP